MTSPTRNSEAIRCASMTNGVFGLLNADSMANIPERAEGRVRPLVALILLLLCALQGCDMKLRGSKEDVERQLGRDFPIGMGKDAVIAKLVAEYGVPTGKINEAGLRSPPTGMGSNGGRVTAHSWITVPLTEYRSIRQLFFKTNVGAQFDFDGDQRLVVTRVFVSHGPEL
jgi:hypothetical protein